jgi:hypothetical protein
MKRENESSGIPKLKKRIRAKEGMSNSKNESVKNTFREYIQETSNLVSSV